MFTAQRPAAQARTANAKPAFRCEECGHRQHRIIPEPAKPSPFRLWRLILLKFYRDSTGCRDHYLRNDAKGRDFLLAQLVFGLPPDDADQLAPWITAQELDAMTDRAAHIEPTLDNISRIIGLTSAQRDKYGWRVDQNGQRKRSGILVFTACDETPEQTEQRRKAAKNAARNVRRQAQTQHAEKCSDPRQAAVLVIIERIAQRPGATVITARLIMDAANRAERALFPRLDTSFRRYIERMRPGFVRRGYRWLSGADAVAKKLPTDPPTVKSLKSHKFTATRHGPDQGKEPQVVGLGDGALKRLASEEFVTTAGPYQAGCSVESSLGEGDYDQAIDGSPTIEHVNAASGEQEQAMRQKTDEDRLEIAYMFQRIDAMIRDTIGETTPTVETGKDNITRIKPPRRRVLDAEAKAKLAQLREMRAKLERL